MELGMKLVGFDEFDAVLLALGERVENRVLQAAVNGAARVGRNAVKAAAPVHLQFQSAASKKYHSLKENIKVYPSKIERQTGKRGAFITTHNAFWGYFYEKGTHRYAGKRVHRAGYAAEHGTRYQPARPWFGPAITGAEQPMLAEMQKRLAKGIIDQCAKNGFPAADENS